MIKTDISIANEQDKYTLDEEKTYNSSVKMLECALNTENIINLSKIDTKKLKNIKFNADIMFCLDEHIHELNRNYRGFDKPTDVLSFALFVENPDAQIIIDNQVSLGEIIISLETTERQAKENNKTFEEELNFLLSHGILHLLGFDHPDEESLELMLQIQDRLIFNIN